MGLSLLVDEWGAPEAFPLVFSESSARDPGRLGPSQGPLEVLPSPHLKLFDLRKPWSLGRNMGEQTGSMEWKGLTHCTDGETEP